MNKTIESHTQEATRRSAHRRADDEAVNDWAPCEEPADDAAPSTNDPRVDRFLCPVDEAARIVGQKWTLQIVHHLLDGRARRFCELQEALGKVNPSTLSSRLKMLEEAGLVRRSQISNIPPHVEYTLTTMGAELRSVIIEITRWSNAHLCGPKDEQAEEASFSTLRPAATAVAASRVKETA